MIELGVLLSWGLVINASVTGNDGAACRVELTSYSRQDTTPRDTQHPSSTTTNFLMTRALRATFILKAPFLRFK